MENILNAYGGSLQIASSLLALSGSSIAYKWKIEE